jgi:hypothetical protein
MIANLNTVVNHFLIKEINILLNNDNKIIIYEEENKEDNAKYMTKKTLRKLC